MLLKLDVLRKHRDFRLLYFGQVVSFIGSMMTFVAVPYQVFELSHSSLLVGLLGTAQLVPLLLTALWGGAYSDVLDRRKLLVVSEGLMALGSLALALNSLMPHPSLILIFATSAFMSAVNGFHRPALDALIPRLVPREDLTAVSALGSLRFSIGAIAGPAVAGLAIANLGLTGTYLIDVVSFIASVLAIMRMSVRTEASPGGSKPSLGAIAEGLRYALSRPELVGTYVVDMIAMTFAMPMALFPALAERWGGAHAAGWLYSAMSIGSLAVTLTSGWTGQVRRHGAAVIVSAAIWGVAIVAFGYAPGLASAVFCLALAGGADTVSAIFRSTIWNETIPTELRGRLASVEMISYMSGPPLGNTRAGWLATVSSERFSIVSGGVLCVAGVLACVPLLPTFWRYHPPKREEASS